jgi:hypothetical protein
VDVLATVSRRRSKRRNPKASLRDREMDARRCNDAPGVRVVRGDKGGTVYCVGVERGDDSATGLRPTVRRGGGNGDDLLKAVASTLIDRMTMRNVICEGSYL